MNKVELTESQRQLTKKIIEGVRPDTERTYGVAAFIAKELSLSRQAVHNWLKRGIPAKPARYFQWFQAKGVPLEDLLRSRGLE